jgi:sigma-B regulation protein RsbU (phosphoserine phosphatase)
MATKILSVDDEQDLEILLTHYFRRKIRKGDYEFKFAHNGLEALKLMIEEPDFDIILSDINMPEMDGLTLLSRINELRNPAQKCIMVSAYGDMKNIRTAMNRGAFDFATKPIDMDDLSVTIEKAIEEINYINKRSTNNCKPSRTIWKWQRKSNAPSCLADSRLSLNWQTNWKYSLP